MRDFATIFQDIVNINKLIVDQKIDKHPPLSEGMKIGYNQFVKPAIKNFEKTHNLKLSECIKEVMHSINDESLNSLDYRFFGNWGRKVNPFVWATWFVKNKNDRPASHSAQIYLLIDHSGLKFGFDYGDSVTDNDSCVESVKDDNALQMKILKSINELELIVVNHGAGEPSINLKSNPTENIIKNIDDFKSWNKDIHIIKSYSFNEIGRHIKDEIVNVLNSLLPLLNRKEPLENSENVGYWLYSPGKGAENWEEEFSRGIMSIDYGFPDDLSDFQSKSDLEDVRAEYGYEEGSMKNTFRALWDFSHEINVGDVIIAKQGRSRYLGYGIVQSDYNFNESNTGFNHSRKVNWIKKGDWKVDSGSLPPKTLTNITPYGTYVDTLKLKFGIDQVEDPKIPEFNIDQVIADVFLDKSEVLNIVDLLSNKKNIILQGSAGVGKTFIAKKIAKCLQEDYGEDRIEMVQFHQSYSYEDFIQGYRPTKSSFELKEGVFFDLCQRAKEDFSSPYFLIIDEINRGNLSKIFGELMMLIESDKRGERNSITLTYNQSERFYVPDNLYIIGTMNTADRSLTIVDYALRRRFAFIKMRPNYGNPFSSLLKTQGIPDEIVNTIISKMSKINEIIVNDESLGEGFEIGHSYFCSFKSGDHRKWYDSVIRYEILPLIDEYWFDDKDLASQYKSLIVG